MLKITLDDNQAIQKLTKIASQLQRPRELYGVLGETLKKIHKARFEAEIDPQGKCWQALSPRTKALKIKRKKSGKILRQDGYLADKTAYNYDDKSVKFGSDAKYARLHQFGGNAGRGKKVKIPARPWLGISDRDGEKLLRKATALLQRQINQIVG
ncbi:TPA: phage virion morphogenesis protein [Pasteurella multocida]|nr:phage virion morphogenesis protein [Pasteurella multocida]